MTSTTKKAFLIGAAALVTIAFCAASGGLNALVGAAVLKSANNPCLTYEQRLVPVDTYQAGGRKLAVAVYAHVSGGSSSSSSRTYVNVTRSDGTSYLAYVKDTGICGLWPSALAISALAGGAIIGAIVVAFMLWNASSYLKGSVHVSDFRDLTKFIVTMAVIMTGFFACPLGVPIVPVAAPIKESFEANAVGFLCGLFVLQGLGAIAIFRMWYVAVYVPPPPPPPPETTEARLLRYLAALKEYDVPELREKLQQCIEEGPTPERYACIRFLAYNTYNNTLPYSLRQDLGGLFVDRFAG